MMLGDVALDTLSPAGVLLALLVSGHVLADFLVQTESIAARKGRHAGTLLLHAALTLLTHAILLLPFWSLPLALPLLALAVYHLLLDAAKGRVDARRSQGGGLAAFFVDQALHVVGLLAVWGWLRWLGVAERPPLLVPETALAPLAAWAVIASGLVLNGKGGTAVVRTLLSRYPTLIPAADPARGLREEGAERDESGPSPSPADYEMGRTIGVLERLIVFVLVLVGQWGAIGLVVAAKSIARFPELGSQRFADYYLMGTLASILTAVVVGMAVNLVIGGPIG
jgi:hypothetical protein